MSSTQSENWRRVCLLYFELCTLTVGDLSHNPATKQLMLVMGARGSIRNVVDLTSETSEPLPQPSQNKLDQIKRAEPAPPQAP